MPGLEHESRTGKIYGVVIVVVTNNQDPDKLGRVKVRFPWLDDQDESNWARIATTMAGNNRGTFFLPEVDDEVLVAFDHGNVQRPYNDCEVGPTGNFRGRRRDAQIQPA